MKRKFILFFFAALISQFCAQSPKPKENNKIEKTNIPGTRLHLGVPEGFIVSESITGIEKNENTAISVMDLTEGNYYSTISTFTKSNFESKGVTVVSFKEHEVGGFPAKTVHLKTFKTEGFGLVFGDSTFSTMVTGMIPLGDSVSLNQVKKCLESISYDKTMKIDPLEFAKFELDTKKSKYKFAKSSASIYMYSIDGIVKDSYDDDPMFTVNQLPYDKTQMTPKLIAQQMILSQMQYGLYYDKLEEESTEKINGYKSYETHFRGELKGKQVLMYLLVVVKGDNSFTCIGMAKSDFEKQLKEYQNLAKSITLKY